MDKQPDFWQRFGGHLLLVIVALILVASGQIGRFSNLFGTEEEMAEDSAVFSIPTPTPQIALEATPETADETLTVPLSAFPVVSDDSLAPLPNPRTFQAKLPALEFETYLVQAGDTPGRIAEKFGITSETLLGGNPWLSQESNALQAGVELVVLPIDGVLHTVKPGETLEDIAAEYDVSVDDIVGYAQNNLEFPFRLVPDTQLMIPGAQIGSFYWVAPKTVANSRPGQWAVIGTGFFTWPVAGRCITNYFWAGHPGLDVSMSVGSPVYAADRGTITYASWASGSYYDYGNLIVINHGNGYETFYAHLSGINVYSGQTVESGQLIGYSGNTGRSSGPHIHIEIRLNDFRDNPLNYLSGPTQDCT